MKLLLGLVLAFSLPVWASQNTKIKADPKQEVFGLFKNVKGETKTVNTLMKNKEKFNGTFVRVQGKAVDVCPMAGCWVTLEDVKTGEKVKVKVKDGEIVFPSNIVGKTLTVEGVLKAKTLNKKRATAYMKHLAEEKNEKFDPKSVKGPMTLYTIQGTAAKINK